MLKIHSKNVATIPISTSEYERNFSSTNETNDQPQIFIKFMVTGLRTFLFINFALTFRSPNFVVQTMCAHGQWRVEAIILEQSLTAKHLDCN